MSIITPSGLPTELTEITNGETLIEVYNPDTGQNEKTEIDTIKQYITDAISGSTILDAIFPIGKRVIQLPGESSPAVLYTSQTWSNISSSFAGDFFRVEGGVANTYDSGEQLDQFQGHWHNLAKNTGSTSDEDFGSDNYLGYRAGSTVKIALATTNQDNTVSIQGAIADGTNGTPRVGSSTYPINHTIRIWERTA
jgi:hypothetical protein